jgi:hypothetical protein
MVTYNLDDRYCPEGHAWTFIPSNLLFSDCYYCKTCDKIYEPTVKEVTKEWFAEHFNSDRFNDIKQRAQFLEAKEKVNLSDLIRLGYLK